MTALQPGQMLGQYQITSQIGKGGMATVYKAYQASMDRYVALKVVSGQVMDDPNFLQRFTQEARLIARLEHPHILPVHDFGEADGTPYMVMRFLEAGTLTERLTIGQMPLPEVDRIFSQLTDALGYAHEHGVIHRDIKPSNAMLDKRGDVFLTDFGIAKMLEGSPGLTAEGAITGTPSYMSPEQAQGNKVDQRSDIYSLGVVLFEMLTGRVPFEAETPMAVLFKQILDPPPPLSTVRPDLPYTLEIVLLRALSKKADDRYPTMDAFRAAWKNALAEAADAPPVPAPVTQKPAPAADPVQPVKVEFVMQNTPAKKGPNWALLSAGIFAGLVVCFGLGAFLFTGGLIGAMQVLGGATAIVKTPAIGIPVNDQPAASQPNETQSWAGANSIYSIAFRGDEVLTAGSGGITIWKPDGTHSQLTTADGLPSANASAIFVDTDGSLWVGSTDAGITHLAADKKAITYTLEQGLDNNYVFFITRSGERLLAATQSASVEGGGLLVFDDNRWQPLAGFPSKLPVDEKSVSANVRQVLTDLQGNLWVVTESGLAMLDGDQKWQVFKTIAGVPDDSVRTAYVDAAGSVWVGTPNGKVLKFDPSKQAFESFADLNEHGVYDVYNILEDKTGNFWFAGDALARYSPATKQWTTFKAEDGSLPIAGIHSARMNEQGVLYFGSPEHGLLRYADEKFEKLQVLNAPHYGQYGRIVPAPDGTLLFLEREGYGVEMFDPASESWSKVLDRYGPRVFDSKGRLWSGSYDGLWIFDKDKTTHITKTHGLPSETVNAIALNPDGTAYIATGEGVALFDGEKVKEVYTFAQNDLLITDNALNLLLASDGSLWVGLSGGFSRRLPDGSLKHFASDKLFGGYNSDFSAFVEDREGNIWIATLGDGLYQFPKNGEPKRMLATDPGVNLPSNYLTSMALAPDGSLWIGSGGQGAVRYDVKSKTWQRYGIKEGLMQLNVNGIYAEPDGAIWFTTNGGITRLVP